MIKIHLTEFASAWKNFVSCAHFFIYFFRRFFPLICLQIWLDYLTMPALFTSKSIPPNVFSIHENALFTSSSLVISHSTAFNWPSAPNKLKRSASTLSFRRAKPHTIIPCLTNSVQIAAPIPLEAPETTATRPAHRSIFTVEIGLSLVPEHTNTHTVRIDFVYVKQ